MLSHFHLYGEQRSSGVMGRHNGPSGLRDDDDDDEEASSAGAITVHSVVAPSGELRGKGRCDVWAGKTV